MNYKRYRNIVTVIAFVVTVLLVVAAVDGVWPWEYTGELVKNSTVNVTATAEVGG